MRLFDFLKKGTNKIYTENGDIANRTTLNYCVDLFGVIGSSRMNIEGVVNLFEKAYKENPKLSLKILMYSRDPRGGLGERESFRAIFSYLSKYKPHIAKQLILYIPEYGRYDDLFSGLKTEIDNDIIEFIKKTLNEDLNNLAKGDGVTLLAKWMPSINTSSKRVVSLAKYLSNRLKMSSEEYRKMLSKLRKGKIVENNLREKDYTFDYQQVPSLAMHKYRNAFFKNDFKRYSEYLFNVDKKNKKINTDVLYLYDILKEAYGSWGEIRSLSEYEQLAMQVKWNNYPKQIDLGNTIIVRDGSGSMTCNNAQPLLIANSLAIYFSELLPGNFKNKFITFSNEPKLVELQSKDLYGKLIELSGYDDASNTNIAKVYDLLLETYKQNIDKRDLIERVIIISDMEFDLCVDGVSSFDTFKEKFDKLNIKMPEVVFWNVNARRIHFASDNYQKNIRYISGASSKIVDCLVKGKELENLSFITEAVSKYDFIDNFDLKKR